MPRLCTGGSKILSPDAERCGCAAGLKSAQPAVAAVFKMARGVPRLSAQCLGNLCYPAALEAGYRQLILSRQRTRTAPRRDAIGRAGLEQRRIGISGGLPETLERRPAGQARLIPVATPAHPMTGPARGAAHVARNHVQLVLADAGRLTEGRDLGVIALQSWRLGDLGAKQALLLAGLGLGNGRSIWCQTIWPRGGWHACGSRASGRAGMIIRSVASTGRISRLACGLVAKRKTSGSVRCIAAWHCTNVCYAARLVQCRRRHRTLQESATPTLPAMA